MYIYRVHPNIIRDCFLLSSDSTCRNNTHTNKHMLSRLTPRPPG